MKMNRSFNGFARWTESCARWITRLRQCYGDRRIVRLMPRTLHNPIQTPKQAVIDCIKGNFFYPIQSDHSINFFHLIYHTINAVTMRDSCQAMIPDYMLHSIMRQTLLFAINLFLFLIYVLLLLMVRGRVCASALLTEVTKWRDWLSLVSFYCWRLSEIFSPVSGGYDTRMRCHDDTDGNYVPTERNWSIWCRCAEFSLTRVVVYSNTWIITVTRNLTRRYLSMGCLQQ